MNMNLEMIDVVSSSLFLYPSQIESKARESLTVVYSKLGLLIVCHVLG